MRYFEDEVVLLRHMFVGRRLECSLMRPWFRETDDLCPLGNDPLHRCARHLLVTLYLDAPSALARLTVISENECA